MYVNAVKQRPRNLRQICGAVQIFTDDIPDEFANRLPRGQELIAPSTNYSTWLRSKNGLKHVASATNWPSGVTSNSIMQILKCNDNVVIF
ncbi:hypothetical protein IAD21_00173 [Abditibacteriota bacterium]|nr:hypothetical protein IAD21_00173 [Abditibacteriota bacterium]